MVTVNRKKKLDRFAGLTEEQQQAGIAKFAQDKGMEEETVRTRLAGVGALPKPTVATAETPVKTLTEEGLPEQDTTDTATDTTTDVVSAAPTPMTGDRLIDLVAKGNVDPTSVTKQEKLELARYQAGKDLRASSPELFKDSAAPTRVTAEEIADAMDKGKSLIDRLTLGGVRDQNQLSSIVGRVQESLINQGVSKEAAEEVGKELFASQSEAMIGAESEKLKQTKATEVEAKREKALKRAQEAADREIKSVKASFAFSGFGRSTAAADAVSQVESNLTGLQEQINAKYDLEQQLFDAEVKGLETTQIADLRSKLAEIDNTIAETDKINADKIAELNQKSNIAFDKALENILGIVSDDTQTLLKGVDQAQTVKNGGYASDAEGNIILVNGKPFAIKGTTEDASAINNFADEIISTGKTSFSIPDRLKEGVINKVAALRKEKELSGEYKKLTPLDKLAAKNLSTKLFGKRAGDKQENIELIQSLMGAGQTIDDIEDSLRESGFGADFTGPVRNAFNKVSVGYSKDQRDRTREELEEMTAIYGKDSQEVREYMLGLADEAVTSTEKQQNNGRIQMLYSMNEIEKQLKDYVAKGGNTNLISGGLENLFNKVLKNTNDPELAQIAGQIAISLQNYRKALSGAAFTEAENEEYQSILPSTGNTPELNQAKLKALYGSLDNFTDQFYRSAIGAKSYNDLFPGGALPVLLPGEEATTRTGTVEFDPEDEAQLNGIFGEETTTQTTEGGFTTSSGFKFEGFNGAGEAAITTQVTEGKSQNRADRNNNPGNVKIGDVGFGVDDQNHTIFGSASEGYEAMKNDLRAKLTGKSRHKSRITGKPLTITSTLADLASIYAEDPNWVNNVAQISGYTPQTQLKDIDLERLAPAVVRQEGFTGSVLSN